MEMYDTDEQQYNTYMNKLSMRIVELRSEYLKLSDYNKRRFAKDMEVFLKQQGILMTIDQIIKVMSAQ